MERITFSRIFGKNLSKTLADVVIILLLLYLFFLPVCLSSFFLFPIMATGSAFLWVRIINVEDDKTILIAVLPTTSKFDIHIHYCNTRCAHTS